MQIHVSPRHLKLTAAIHGYVAEKVEHLEHLAGEIVAAHVVLMHDETATKPYSVKVHLAVPGPDIHAEDKENDLYAAIDKVVDKVAGQLRKRKTRLTDKTKRVLQVASERRKGTAAR
ncbi:MAG TPA: ribosome-associated translation inhibitor RaiA [Chthoniobacterales bacterium]|jgi:putative sigma-54 modulation protein